ncbi:uncharacterized protein LOC143041287 [Oratosquilla oratoria]|uniref:uncharacterized protein LOC143041287 n=1 Tax=Oratosquilla oratoria TaxID=337810 RepID=UPI003F75A5B1
MPKPVFVSLNYIAFEAIPNIYTRVREIESSITITMRVATAAALLLTGASLLVCGEAIFQEGVRSGANAGTGAVRLATDTTGRAVGGAGRITAGTVGAVAGVTGALAGTAVRAAGGAARIAAGAAGAVAGAAGAAVGTAAGAVGAVTALTLGAKASLARGRQRRSAAATAECLLPVSDPEVYFSLAADADPLGCGLRLLCEIEATPDHQLAADERLLLGIFGRTETIPATSAGKRTTTSPRAGFQWAAYVGSKVSDVSECTQLFGRCPFDRASIMDVFRRARDQEDEL